MSAALVVSTAFNVAPSPTKPGLAGVESDQYADRQLPALAMKQLLHRAAIERLAVADALDALCRFLGARIPPAA